MVTLFRHRIFLWLAFMPLGMINTVKHRVPKRSLFTQIRNTLLTIEDERRYFFSALQHFQLHFARDREKMIVSWLERHV